MLQLHVKGIRMIEPDEVDLLNIVELRRELRHALQWRTENISRRITCKVAEHWPTTADDVRGFVGSGFCSMRYGREDQTPDDGDIYTMSAHDIASAIGNWRTYVLGHDGIK